MILYTITIKITVDFYVKESQQKKKLNITESNYIDFIIGQIEKRDFKLIQKDVEKFLFDMNELNLLTKDFIISLCNNLKS